MVITRDVELIGPNKGKDMLLGGIQFRGGKATLTGPETDVEKQFRYLHRCWQVKYADEGTQHAVQNIDEPDTNGPLPGNSDGDQERAAQAGADDGGAADDAALHDQDGQANAPIVNPRLLEAVSKLDANNDDHWTRTGKPAMSALEMLYGSSDITRADVDAAAPGLSREEAYTQAKG